jgi:O-antigen/teichoic acid export membrane protein
VINKLKALRENDGVMRYFKNSSWMMAEYSLRIVSAIFVSIYVARYLGPVQFGALSFALAIVAIFMAVSRLGMDNVLVRDISRHPEKTKEYIGTAFGLMFISAIVAMSIIGILIFFLESDFKSKLYMLIIATGLFFQSLFVIDYSFQAQVKAKYSSIAKTIALVFSSLLKIYLVWIQADLFLFALAFALDTIFIGIMLLSVYLIKKQPVFFGSFHLNLVKPLLISAWPLMLTAGMGILLLKFDQIIIGIMLGDKEVGLYTAALRIYEGWIMMPQILAMSLIPAIVSLKKQSNRIYEDKMTIFMRIIISINIGIAVLVSLFSEEVIKLLYGEAFASSSNVLQIVIWCAVMMGIGSISFRYLINEGLEYKMINIMLTAMISNIILNIVLVPIMGIEGAAWALLFSLLISYVFYDLFDKKLSQLTRIKLRAIYVK